MNSKLITMVPEALLKVNFCFTCKIISESIFLVALLKRLIPRLATKFIIRNSLEISLYLMSTSNNQPSKRASITVRLVPPPQISRARWLPSTDRARTVSPVGQNLQPRANFNNQRVPHKIHGCDSMTKAGFITKTLNKGQTQKNISFSRSDLKCIDNLSNLTIQSGLYILHGLIKHCATETTKIVYCDHIIKSCYMEQTGRLVFTDTHFKEHRSKTILREDEAVAAFVEFVSGLCVGNSLGDFYYYYKRAASKKMCDFRYMGSLIQSYCKCAKIIMAGRVACVKSKAEPGKQESRYKKVKTETNIPAKVDFFKSKTKHLICFSRNSYQQSISRRASHIDRPQESKINNQLNLAIKPTVSQASTEAKTCQNSQSMTMSSNINSTESSRINLGARLLGSHRIQSCHKLGEFKLSFNFNTDVLDEVESLTESSNKSHLNSPLNLTRLNETDREQLVLRENQQKILQQNNWTKKINNLLEQASQLKESIITGIQIEEPVIQDNTCLGKMARALTQSIMPQPLQVRRLQF